MSGSARIGHNGGPRLPLPRKLSDAQARALRWIRDYGDGAHGLYGRSQIGGWNNTRWWLSKEKLALINHLDSKEAHVLTARGERVLAAGRLVD